MDREEKNFILLTQGDTGKIAEQEITREEMERIFFNDGDIRENNVHLYLPEPGWEKIYEDGRLIYEGFTVDHKAFGAGRCFLRDGSLYMEGFFGIKGFLSGRVYGKNRMILFEGSFRMNHAYGPNFPEYGSWYGEDGKLKYRGKFSVSRSSLGWPRVSVPEGFGSVPSGPAGHWFTWNDARKYMERETKD